MSIKRIVKIILAGCFRIPIIMLQPLAKRNKSKRVVILMDRRQFAGDNGEAMYHYLKNREDCDAYFVLRRQSKDWKRLQPDNHVLDQRGLRYVWIMLKADIVMFSHTMNWPWCCYGITNRFDIKQVFLQHGVIHEDLSQMYNASKGHDFVCVATKPEYIDRHNPSYGYKPEQILLTGLPRFDCLTKRSEKIITIGLTWRKYLKNASLEDIQSSTYFSIIREVMFMPELTDLAEKYGYRVQFVPHPELGESIMQLVEENKDKRITVNTNQTYSEIISETAMMITDYSSLAFDAAYLRTPVVYYQADEEEFYSGKHTYLKGYFDFKRDGFGEVVYAMDKLLEIVEVYLQRECKMKLEYEKRVTNTFEYFDSRNCERVYESIVGLLEVGKCNK